MENNKLFKIKSESDPLVTYDVSYQRGAWLCSCPATKECKHIRKAKLVVEGATKEEIKLVVYNPFLKSYRTDDSYRIEFDISGDGNKGMPQSEELQRLLEWKNCNLELFIRLKK